MKPNRAPLLRCVVSYIAAASVLCTLGCQPSGKTTPPDPKPLPVNTDLPKVNPETARAYPEPPGPSETRPVNFPKIASFEASNGILVFVVENHEVPTVSTQLVLRAGTMDDEYLAAFTAGMLGEGTSARSKAKIDEAIEFVGGTLGAIPSQHTTTVFTHSLHRDLKLALVLMADEVMKATFPAESLEKLKQAARASLRMSTAQPDVLADRLFNRVAYPEGHPYGRALPSEARINEITIADVKKFYSTFYRPNNAFLIFSGDVTAAEAKPIVERTFARWAKVDESKLPINPLNQFKRYTVPNKLVVHVVDRPGSEQVEIRMGTVAIARNHEDWVALQVANNILGDDAGGRLFQDIREERSLTYGIYSQISLGQAPGTFQVTTNTKVATLGPMLGAIFGHLERLRTEAPSETEFNDTVQKMIGRFPLEVETASDIVAKVREILVFGLANDYWTKYRDEIRAVQRSDIQRVAKKYIHPIPHVVLVGSGAEIKAQVEAVLTTATIKMYDTNLRLK
ncbi:MAG: insulinase family protein [Nannocystaceae bacterium]|nr:insulinase family protein [Nannocystaceae bacterium]